MKPGTVTSYTKESATSNALRSKEMRIKFAVAVNPSSCPKILDLLAGDGPDWILERVAENPGTTSETLSKLAKHCCAAVRAAVATNSNTLLDVLLDLVQDESVDVRYSIAENHNMPMCVLESLRDDENPYVSMRAQRTVARLSECNILAGRFSIVTKPLKVRKLQFG